VDFYPNFSSMQQQQQSPRQGSQASGELGGSSVSGLRERASHLGQKVSHLGDDAGKKIYGASDALFKVKDHGASPVGVLEREQPNAFNRVLNALYRFVFPGFALLSLTLLGISHQQGNLKFNLVAQAIARYGQGAFFIFMSLFHFIPQFGMLGVYKSIMPASWPDSLKNMVTRGLGAAEFFTGLGLFTPVLWGLTNLCAWNAILLMCIYFPRNIKMAFSKKVHDRANISTKYGMERLLVQVVLFAWMYQTTQISFTQTLANLGHIGETLMSKIRQNKRTMKLV
jgi:uncharacterized membrane protein